MSRLPKHTLRGHIAAVANTWGTVSNNSSVEKQQQQQQKWKQLDQQK
jgi:hypothetical protein